MRIWKYTPKTSTDNWQTLKAKQYWKTDEKINNKEKLAKKYRKNNDVIEEWFNDYIDYSAEKKEELLVEINGKIINILDYEDDISVEWFFTNKFWVIAIDKEKDEFLISKDKYFLSELDLNWLISIENNWKNIKWSNLISVKNEIWITVEVMPFGILMDYIPVWWNSLEEKLNIFIDKYEIQVMDELERNKKSTINNIKYSERKVA